MDLTAAPSSRERNRSYFFNPFVLGETPDADVTTEQIAVLVPVDAAGSALIIDLSALGENAELRYDDGPSRGGAGAVR